MKAANDAFAAWYEGKNDLRGYTTEDGFLAGYAAALRPIPCNENLPEKDQRVLGFRYSAWQTMRFVGGVRKWDSIPHPTHWLPLPPIPTEEPVP